MSDEEWLSVEQVATLIGRSARRVLDLAAHGELPAYQTGGIVRKRWRFRRSEIEAWLQKQRNRPEDER